LVDTHNFEKEAEKFLEIEESRNKKDLKFGPVKPKK
jgi:hypothetical protein